MKKLIVLIPAYEPEEKFIDLVVKLNKNKLDIIVVDDGSGEDYDEVFSKVEEKAVVLRYEKNMGKGFALKTGIKYIVDKYKKDYVIITMDCDGQHRIEDALKLGEYASDNDNELVLGKRIRGENTPILSKFGNNVTRYFNKLITGVDIYDTQTGLRAFSNDLALLMLEIEGDRFEYEMNVLLEFIYRKIKIVELEIKTIYIDNNKHSHFNTIKDSFKIYRGMFKYMKKNTYK